MLTLTGLMTDQIHSQNLVPFKKRRGPYHIPGMTGENEERTLEVDPDLNAEEQRYIRHYLGYADSLLKHAPAEPLELQEDDSAPEIVTLAEDVLGEATMRDTAIAEISETESQESSEQSSHDKAA